jgi:hypothetical protein
MSLRSNLIEVLTIGDGKSLIKVGANFVFGNLTLLIVGDVINIHAMPPRWFDNRSRREFDHTTNTLQSIQECRVLSEQAATAYRVPSGPEVFTGMDTLEPPSWGLRRNRFVSGRRLPRLGGCYLSPS